MSRSAGASVALFAERATRVGCQVLTVGREALADEIQRWGHNSASGTLGLSQEVRGAFPELSGLDRRGSDWPEAAVGLGMFGVVETGSVAVAETNHADRLMALLCLRHMLLLPAAAMVPSLHDAAGILRGWLGRGACRYVTLISGPSRTSDIERVLTIGVHGPRKLTIVLVEGWDRPHA